MTEKKPHSVDSTAGQMIPFVHSPFVNSQKVYSPPPYPAPIDLHLDGNEGAAVSKELLAEVAAFDVEMVRRYPKNGPLETLLAKRFEVPSGNVIVTAGADDALERIIRAAVGPGSEVLMPVPTFEMIDRYVQLAGGVVQPVLWLDGPFPLQQMLQGINERTAMLAVVTPNSPTGLTVSFADIAALSAAAPHLFLLVDLAYIEFADSDITAQVLSLPNAIVTRTLSKAYGLAGARVGYALGCEEAIALMRAAGHPYAVSSISLMLAMRRLQSDDGQMAIFVAEVRRQREALLSMLRENGITAGPSEGNFIFVTSPHSVELRNGLARHGIGVRGFSQVPHLDNALRITVPGNRPHFDRLFHALQTLIEELPPLKGTTP